jgi:hypothetical protein
VTPRSPLRGFEVTTPTRPGLAHETIYTCKKPIGEPVSSIDGHLKGSGTRRSIRTSQQIVETTFLHSIAKRPIRPLKDDLVTNLEEGDLAYLTLRGFRALKRHLARGERSRCGRSSMNSSNMVIEPCRTLQPKYRNWRIWMMHDERCGGRWRRPGSRPQLKPSLVLLCHCCPNGQLGLVPLINLKPELFVMLRTLR